MKPVRLGILGLMRGAYFADVFSGHPGVRVAAVCDNREEPLRRFAAAHPGTAAYTGYRAFLGHDLDAVMICGYCTEHAPQAIQALESGRDVLSEVIACKTLAEGVALCRAVERTRRIYMFAENYCYFAYIQEMARLYRAGAVGDYIYGECEYVHGLHDSWKHYVHGRNHWRNWLPPTYYCTHSLGPVMKVTGTRPVSVAGFIVPNRISRTVGRCADDGALMACRMDNGAVTKVLPWCNFHRHPASVWYSFYGTKGAMENGRWSRDGELGVYTRGGRRPRFYRPSFEGTAARASRYGHGGGDWFVARDFLGAVRRREQPWLDVYRAMDMTLPGILAYRSALGGNRPLAVPDFRRESERRRFERDRWSPDPAEAGRRGQPAPSVLGRIRIPPAVYRRKINSR